MLLPMETSRRRSVAVTVTKRLATAHHRWPRIILDNSRKDKATTSEIFVREQANKN